MLPYLVEFMRGDEVIETKTVPAGTPFMAAVTSTGREVTLKVDRAEWIRVTPPGKPPFEYGYATASEAEEPAPPRTDDAST